MQSVVGIALLVVGAVLIIFGMQASASVGSRLSELFTGTPSDRTIWLLCSRSRSGHSRARPVARRPAEDTLKAPLPWRTIAGRQGILWWSAWRSRGWWIEDKARPAAISHGHALAYNLAATLVRRLPSPQLSALMTA